MKPLNYDFRKNYPLIVGLAYTCADDNERQIAGCGPAQWLSEEKNRARYPAFIFVSRCPKGTGWGGVPNNPSIENLALEAITALIKQSRIDKKNGVCYWYFKRRIWILAFHWHPPLPFCGGNTDLWG
jgi:hypothetical protein